MGQRALTFFMLMFFTLAARAGDYVVEGRVLERGTKIPLVEVSVYLLPQKAKAITNEQGRYRFENVDEGSVELIVNLSGYEKFSKTLDVSPTSAHSPEVLYIEKITDSIFQTTVTAIKDRRDQSVLSLSRNDFIYMPGANGDPVKAVQNLPGINRVGGLSSQVVIQGSAPGDTRYLVDGIEVPNIFHFGGFSSVVIPQAVDQVNYFSAGYGPRYSRALGGVIELKTRLPEVSERPAKGFIFVDTLNSGGLIETKIDKTSSLLIGGRYSYIGQVLRAVAKNNDQVGFSVAPEFSDLSAVYQKKLNDQDDLKVTGLYSHDRLGFVFKEPLRGDPGVRGDFNNVTEFYRIIPQWTRKMDTEQTLNVTLGLGHDMTKVNVGTEFFDLQSSVLAARADYERRITSYWKTTFGTDNQFTQARVQLKLPLDNERGGVETPIASRAEYEISKNIPVYDLGLYWRNELQTEGSAFKVLPSLRIDKFNRTKENFLPAPRLAVQHQTTESLLLKAATGLYYQPPQPQESDADIGNPDIRSPKVWHYTAGFEKDFRERSSQGFTWAANIFDREFENLVNPSSAVINQDGVLRPEYYANSGKGRAYGADSLLRWTDMKWSGFISYTYLKSTRQDPINGPYRSQYDQTNNFNLTLARELPHSWRLSTRYRYVTGNPVTPVVGATFDADNDVYIPRRGPLYSSRLRDFSQLDLRIDKRWVLQQSVWFLYLDIQNVLNSKNPQSLTYSYDYRTQGNITGIPILPALGVRGEF